MIGASCQQTGATFASQKASFTDHREAGSGDRCTVLLLCVSKCQRRRRGATLCPRTTGQPSLTTAHTPHSFPHSVLSAPELLSQHSIMPLLTSSARTARSDTHIVAAQCTHDVSAPQDASPATSSQAEPAEEDAGTSTTLANGTLRLIFSAGVKLPSRKRRRRAQGGARGRGARREAEERASQQQQASQSSSQQAPQQEVEDETQLAERVLTARELIASGTWSLIMDFLTRVGCSLAFARQVLMNSF